MSCWKFSGDVDNEKVVDVLRHFHLVSSKIKQKPLEIESTFGLRILKDTRNRLFCQVRVYFVTLLLITLLSNFQTRPAFQATLTTGNIGPNYALGAIKFNDVSFNIGGAYNPSTGKFTAPVDGLYLFSVSYLQRNGYRSYVRLMKDNTVYSDLHANHRNYDQLSKTVLAMLKKGQTFWVRLERNGVYAVYGRGRYTTFGGYLISY